VRFTIQFVTVQKFKKERRFMRRTFIAAWVFLLLLTPSLIHAQPAAPPACQGRDLLGALKSNDPKAFADIRDAADAIPNGRALLWRIERQGRPASFLFGTIHSTDERVHKFSPAVKSAFNAANRVALELSELASDNPGEAMAKAKNINKLAVYTSGAGLAGHLSKAELEALGRALGTVGVPPNAVPAFRPWFAWAALAMPTCENRRGAAGLAFLDQRIGRDALKAGKRVIGLETIDDQVGALAGLPEATQVFLLRTTLAIMDSSVDQWEVLHRQYLARDLGVILPFTLHLIQRAGFDTSLFGRFERDLIDRRNITMRNAALPLLQEGNAFIAVGALHLPGKAGLVDLFRAAGYTVTAVE